MSTITLVAGEPEPLPDLHLHVRTCYFEQIKAGEKTEEYRLFNDYWKKRLMPGGIVYRKEFRNVVIYNAYKPGEANRLTLPWRGWFIQSITHPHFNNKPEFCFCIRLTES